jgi:Dolichyl-phosphate-mannose-protein mannosyltransferase
MGRIRRDRLIALRSSLVANVVLGAVAMSAAVIVLAYLGEVQPSLLWDAPSYFINARRFSEEFPYVPPLDFRAFGYPAFLKLFQSGDNFDIAGIVAAQKVLFVANAVLVYWIALRVTGSRGLGLIAALLFALNFRIMLLANSIMAETVAVFLELIVVGCVVEFAGKPSKPEWLLTASAVLVLAIFVRPTFIVALPIIVLCALLASERPIWRRAVLATAITTIAVAPVVAYAYSNYKRTGYFKAFHGAGFSSLNYVTNPCFFQKLSDRLAYVREPLSAFQSREFPELSNIAGKDPRCLSWFWPYARPRGPDWGNTYGDVLKPAFHQRYGEPGLDWDTLAMRITIDAVRDQPVEYLRIWSQVFTEFWTAYRYLDGYYASVADLEQRRPVVRPSALGFFNQVEKANGYIAWLSLPIVLAALAASLGRVPGSRSRRAILFIGIYCVLYSLLSTGMEAAHAQSRYRVPLDPLVLVCFAFIASFASRARAAPPSRRSATRAFTPVCDELWTGRGHQPDHPRAARRRHPDPPRPAPRTSTGSPSDIRTSRHMAERYMRFL